MIRIIMNKMSGLNRVKLKVKIYVILRKSFILVVSNIIIHHKIMMKLLKNAWEKKELAADKY